jgi:tetratricopeptide (TPR) repeat protein
MNKNQIQNYIFTALGVALLIGAGFQFTKNRNNFLEDSTPSNISKAGDQTLIVEGSKGMEGSHNNELHSKTDDKKASLNNLDTHNHEENVDHSDPKNQRRMGIFHYNEGNKLLALKKWKESITNYQMALKHDEKLFEVYINLSVAQLRIEDFDQAYLTLQKLKNFQPQNPSLFYNLACYYSLTKQPEFGRVAIQKAVQLGFKNFPTLKTDPDLENLKNDKTYVEWLTSL